MVTLKHVTRLNLSPVLHANADSCLAIACCVRAVVKSPHRNTACVLESLSVSGAFFESASIVCPIDMPSTCFFTARWMSTGSMSTPTAATGAVVAVISNTIPLSVTFVQL